MEKVIFAAT